MGTIQIELPELHPGQQRLLSEAGRFNVARCGRRWGKTVIASELLIDPALDGHPTAYFTPVYKTLEEVWNEVTDILAPVISKKNSQQKYIKLVTGGRIDFWSLKDGNAPRGRHYKRIIVDEAAFVDNLLDKWQKSLRAMLADLKGDAWFFSSPVDGSDFQKLDEKSQTGKNWKSFHAPTTDNPYISPEEFEEIVSDLPPDVVDQEYRAEYVRFDGDLFANQWTDAYVKPLELDPELDVFLAFDFNISNTCLLIQNIENENKIRVLKEWHYPANFDVFCENLKEELELIAPYSFLIINGDASGSSGSSDNNEGKYEVIKSTFDLSYSQFHVPKANPTHSNSRVLTNIIIRKGMLEVDPSCTGLIRDLNRVKVLNKGGKLEIDKKDQTLTHFLDPIRYHLNSEHKHMLKAVQFQD